MSAPGKDGGMGEQDYAPSAGAFSEKEGRAHEEGIARIGVGIAAGLGFDEACAALTVEDSELRRVIIDDFLKVTVAERHFRDGQSTDEVATALKIEVERVNRAREEMIAEVTRAAVEEFKRQSGSPSPGAAN